MSIKKYKSPLFTNTNITPKIKGDFCIYMKATGIIRRIDDLGRVVIPKEIRRTMRIKEGDLSFATLTDFDRFYIALHSVAERTKVE